jgi:hypothetical protein
METIEVEAQGYRLTTMLIHDTINMRLERVLIPSVALSFEDMEALDEYAAFLPLIRQAAMVCLAGGKDVKNDFGLSSVRVNRTITSESDSPCFQVELLTLLGCVTVVGNLQVMIPLLLNALGDDLSIPKAFFMEELFKALN